MPQFELQKLFEQTLRIRLIEQEIVARYSEQQMRCPVHLSIGQEAAAVAVCDHLNEHDVVTSTHRAHHHYLAKGGDLNAFVAELYGKSSGCSGGKGGSMHLVDPENGFFGAVPILGSMVAISVGIAFADKMTNKSRIVATFFGDGALEEGVVTEAFNFAALHNLPVLFICENNFYSINTPLSERQPENRPLIQLAHAYNIFSVSGNGNNMREAWDASQTCIDHIRSGGGPAFLELETYRFKEHCGPNEDTHLGYRSAEEVAHWQVNDPITMMQNALQLGDRDLDKIAEPFNAEIHNAFKAALDAPFPDEAELQTHVYGL